MLQRFVKVSDVSNLSVARYCAGMFVDLIAFNVDEEDENCISLEKYKEIRGWLSGSKIVIETKSSDISKIRTKIENYQPDYIQFSDINLLNEDFGIGKILATERFENLELENVAFYQINSLENAQINAINSQKIILNLTNNYFDKSLLENTSFHGFNLHSSREERPGFQDFGDLMDILEALDE